MYKPHYVVNSWMTHSKIISHNFSLNKELKNYLMKFCYSHRSCKKSRVLECTCKLSN